MLRGFAAQGCAFVVGALGVAGALGAGDPWADRVATFSPGVGANPQNPDPHTVVGSPERFTGEGVFPSVVSMFNPPFGGDEIVSIGEGGTLVVEFDEPITNDPAHLHGADLIIFGYAFFIDQSWPTGQHTNPAAIFGIDPMDVSVSADGAHFEPLGRFGEGMFPTLGYQDSGPYDDSAGTLPTDFTKPMNPGLSLADFDGLSFAQGAALYDGSGGGTAIDIASSGLSSVRFVRIDVPDIADSEVSIQIDALATVPEPVSASSLLLGLFLLGALRRDRG